MPKTLTSTGATFPAQTSPIPGEARTAGSVETPFQNGSDRDEWLKQRLEHLDPDKGGLRRVRRVANISALQAVTDYPSRTIVQVDGVGLYQFDETSILAELSPLVIKPTNITHPDPGRWIVAGVGYGMLNVANGVPQLDGSGKLAGTRLAICDANGRVIGANVAHGRVSLTATVSTQVYTIPATTTWVDVPGTSFPLTLLTGDIVLVDYHPQWSVTAGEKVSGRIRVTKPDASNDDSLSGGIGAPAGPSLGQRFSFQRHFMAGADGTHTFVLQAQGATANAGTNTVSNVYVRIEVVRP